MAGTDGRILLVDDEPRLLDGLRRTLRGRYAVETAGSGDEGLALLAASVEHGVPFGVVVSDMMMPVMDGAEFLGRARRVVPDAVLMVLSGQADLTSTISAVNNADLFRFLTKPVSPEDLVTALDAALRQHRLVTSERDLLQRTLTGAVDVITDVLAMGSPSASRRTERVRAVVRESARMLGLDDDWRLPVAAMLSHLGCVAVPADVVDRIGAGQPVSPAERAMFRDHPVVGRRLLERIPRLEEVALWVGAQPTSTEAADAPGTPPEDVAACLLPAVAAFFVHHEDGTGPRDAARRLAATGRYPVQLLEAVLAAAGDLVPAGRRAEVRVHGLQPGMTIAEDVTTSGGMVLVRQGERVTEVLVTRLVNFAVSVGVTEPIRVLVPEG